MSVFSGTFRLLLLAGLLSGLLAVPLSVPPARGGVPPEWRAAAHDYDTAAAVEYKQRLAVAVRAYRAQRAWEHRQRLRAGGGVFTHVAYLNAAMTWAATH